MLISFDFYGTQTKVFIACVIDAYFYLRAKEGQKLQNCRWKLHGVTIQSRKLSELQLSCFKIVIHKNIQRIRTFMIRWHASLSNKLYCEINTSVLSRAMTMIHICYCIIPISSFMNTMKLLPLLTKVLIFVQLCAFFGY